MNGFASAKNKLAAVDADRLCLLAHQMHFDPTCRSVVWGAVSELGETEIGTQLPVRSLQQIEIEGGGDTGRIVVGSMQTADVLLDVDADD